jgi:hypothetical protein
MMRTILVWALAWAASPAFGQTITGNDVLSACEANDTGIKKGFCIGYIVGLWEGIHWGTFVAFRSVGGFEEGGAAEANDFASMLLGSCVPEHVENSQITDVVIHYLRDNPTSRHESARGLMERAMAEAFPCPPE